jgi:outer membrane protein assembly factor BamB
MNFFTSGHFAGAILMDMDGRVLHEWRYDFLKVWPDEIESTEIDGSEYWRWAHLFENGDVLAIFDGLGLIKVDRNSNLIWEHLGGEHHDLDVTDDGRIFVLTRRAHMIERINELMPILEDFVAVLDSDGRLLKEVSLLEAFENSNFASSPAARGYFPRGDIYHTNAVEVLDGSLADRIPAFAKGNVLLSMRSLSTIAVLDMDLGEIVWVAADLWLAQHDPKVLDNGNILVFDNRGAKGDSRVVEFDPATREMVWVYAGDRSNSFFTQMCGASHRLENGNTLITESDFGRAFEVTPDGEIVWEFVNPHRAGKRDNLIATLFDVVRLDPGLSLDWLQ